MVVGGLAEEVQPLGRLVEVGVIGGTEASGSRRGSDVEEWGRAADGPGRARGLAARVGRSPGGGGWRIWAESGWGTGLAGRGAVRVVWTMGVGLRGACDDVRMGCLLIRLGAGR